MSRLQCNHRGLKQQKGFSLFEIVVVILLIGVLMSMAIDRLIQLQVDTERVSVQHVIGSLDSAVYMQTAELVLKQGLASLRKLENANPMTYLAKQPFNYEGVLKGEAARKATDSSWYFDPVDDVLIYKVKNKNYFESAEGEPRIRLKLSLVYRDNAKSRNGRNIQGVKLASLHQYSWKNIDE